MSARKLERLVNLTMLLLSTRRYLSVEEIGRLVPGYQQEEPEAFRRMFERDKEELRDLGIPLQTGSEGVWEDEVGYRIPRADYEMPEVMLEPDEAAAVGLAARLWQSAGLAEASASALRKLRAAGIDADPVPTAELDPRVDAAEPALQPCLAAVRAGEAITFDYRGAQAKSAARRTIDPWGVVHRKGRWYVVGHDHDRKAQRAFRLSRVAGSVQSAGPADEPPPPDVDLVAAVAALEAESGESSARVRITGDAAVELRRAARVCTQQRDGTTICDVPYADPERFADWVVGYGPDVVVVEPAEARAAVVARLREMAS
ncbi:MAG: WYL domain-containing protein [Frankia sp.]|nr:WYL domain-containing protein [Frankia sp.]